jgi:E3 ubiquitin-protein ligase RAD18
MNESALRKKLTSLGIPSSGNKAVLVRRHTEWVNIWNANCDSRTPKLKRELLRDLERWDKSQGKTLNGGSALMEKDFDGKAWATNHSDDFAGLIARAREKRKGQSSAEKGFEEEVEHQPNQNQPQENEENAMVVEPQVERGLEPQVERGLEPQVKGDLGPQVEGDVGPQMEQGA